MYVIWIYGLLLLAAPSAAGATSLLRPSANARAEVVISAGGASSSLTEREQDPDLDIINVTDLTEQQDDTTTDYTGFSEDVTTTEGTCVPQYRIEEDFCEEFCGATDASGTNYYTFSAGFKTGTCSGSPEGIDQDNGSLPIWVFVDELSDIQGFQAPDIPACMNVNANFVWKYYIVAREVCEQSCIETEADALWWQSRKDAKPGECKTNGYAKSIGQVTLQTYIPSYSSTRRRGHACRKWRRDEEDFCEQLCVGGDSEAYATKAGFEVGKCRSIGYDKQDGSVPVHLFATTEAQLQVVPGGTDSGPWACQSENENYDMYHVELDDVCEQSCSQNQVTDEWWSARTVAVPGSCRNANYQEDLGAVEIETWISSTPSLVSKQVRKRTARVSSHGGR